MDKLDDEKAWINFHLYRLELEVIDAARETNIIKKRNITYNEIMRYIKSVEISTTSSHCRFSFACHRRLVNTMCETLKTLLKKNGYKVSYMSGLEIDCYTITWTKKNTNAK